MKNFLKINYFLSFFCSIFFLSCSTSADETDVVNSTSNSGSINLQSKGDLLDCPDGQTKILSEEFVTLRLHRASRGCSGGFGICSVTKWVESCVDDDLIPLIREEFYIASRTASVSIIVLPNKQLLFKFPKDMMNDPEFVHSDFNNFGFDVDHDVNGMVVKAGNYLPIFTIDEIQVTVDIR